MNPPGSRNLRLALAASSLLLGLLAVRGDRCSDVDWTSVVSGVASTAPAPEPLATNDADHDGIDDTLEESLAERFAPAVILDAHDGNRPASIPWLLARVDLLARKPDAQLASAVPFATSSSRQRFDREVRAGSGDPHDWATYVHVFPARAGGVHIQYWFFYGYNDGPLFFDHEADWEHITVDVDTAGKPVAVYFAQHENNDPGVFRAWSDVRKTGDHPLVLSARGTHASYPDQASLAWFEKASGCRSAETCTDPVWRTWEAGGLVNMGERGAVLASPAALQYDGRWGQAGNLMPGTSAPRGPLQQRGFCSGGFTRCTDGT